VASSARGKLAVGRDGQVHAAFHACTGTLAALPLVMLSPSRGCFALLVVEVVEVVPRLVWVGVVYRHTTASL
jgi:hypothetical protein